MAKKNSRWSKKIPAEEGWYWLRFMGKDRRMIFRPAAVVNFKDGGQLVSVGGSSFTKETRKIWGFASAKFGPVIEFPGYP